jgi:hypothetical protein
LVLFTLCAGTWEKQKDDQTVKGPALAVSSYNDSSKQKEKT